MDAIDNFISKCEKKITKIISWYSKFPFLIQVLFSPAVVVGYLISVFGFAAIMFIYLGLCVLLDEGDLGYEKDNETDIDEEYDDDEE